MSASSRPPVLPGDAAYVVVGDGHLSLDGRRVRFWGATGGFPGRTHADNAAVAARLAELGFNMVRLWQPRDDWEPCARGDGSPADLTDHFIWCLGRQGMRVWAAGFNHVGRATPADVAIVDDRRTAAAWADAVGPEGLALRNWAARIWDPRLESVALARMKVVADHVNQWTGYRWADDPVIAVWELSNEEWWLRRLMRGSADRLPPFFRQALDHQWNAFLLERYSADARLRAAWGFLQPGESLARRSVTLAPLRIESAFEPWETGLDPRAAAGSGRDRAEDFTAARGAT